MKLSQKRKSLGQGMVEYMLIIGLIALLVFVAIKMLGQNVKGGFENASKAVETASKNWKND